jgi:hypothetical protein
MHDYLIFSTHGSRMNSLFRVLTQGDLVILIHNKFTTEGPDTPDAIRQRDTIFRFSLTDNFDSSLNFPNI